MTTIFCSGRFASAFITTLAGPSNWKLWGRQCMCRWLAQTKLWMLLLVVAIVSAGSAEAAGHNVLVNAAYAGNLAQVKALLAAKADVNARIDNGGTALMAASQKGHREVVQTLLAAKADVNAKAVNGATALMVASHNGHREVVQALLAAKANVNAKRDNGVTALILASQNGHRELVI